MQVSQARFHNGSWSPGMDLGGPAQLVLAFGDRDILTTNDVYADLRRTHPDAHILLCSGGGEIHDDRVVEGSVVASAVRFNWSRVAAAEAKLEKAEDSQAVGASLARDLPHDGLRHVLVFSEGLGVNGSALAVGLAQGLPQGVTVTGGLAADGDRFQKTLVGLNGKPQQGKVAAIGLYGARLRVGMGSLGGWETFGPERTITKSTGNVLYELDGNPALDIYKQAIGRHAYGLPASGLLYPIQVRGEEGDGVVRTLLSVDEKAKSLTFAGDVQEGRKVRLMEANLDRLIEASGDAARRTSSSGRFGDASLALLVSCIGRKLLLQQRVSEEIRSARHALGPAPTFAGFYSYGELSPMTPSVHCELHNQTMTITTLAESADATQ